MLCTESWLNIAEKIVSKLRDWKAAIHYKNK